MKYLFFGTSRFAATILEYLVSKEMVPVAVVTRPDRPQGRSLLLSAPPVKKMFQSLQLAIPLYQPEKASSPEMVEEFTRLGVDLFVVVAYGEILRQNLLNLPRFGAINVHASLLPKYRGAAPMQRCLMHGDAKTGVTIMEMVLQMDAGAMLKKVEMEVPEAMNCGELEEKLALLACAPLIEVIEGLGRAPLPKIEQDPSLVTFAPKIGVEEELLDWNLSGLVLHNKIRALSPTPGAWCWIRVGDEKRRLKIKKAVYMPEKSGAPGSVLVCGKEGLVVACAEGALCLLEVQPEGKRLMRSVEFVQGLQQLLSFTL